MGTSCSCCCGKSSSDSECLTPKSESEEAKRLQRAEAAERRIREQEYRGIKDPEKFKQKTQRLAEIEKKQEEATKHFSNEGPKLTWTVG